MNIAILISGTGSNMKAICAAIDAGELDASVKYVVSSNRRAAGIEWARTRGLPLIVFEPADYDEPEKVDHTMAVAFEQAGVDYVVMAGYMRKVTPVLLDAFPNRVVNLHPALLPKHPGAHAIRDAFEAGDEVTGITFHFANEEYDEGPIISQHEVPVLDGDTLEDLEERIHAAEHEWYPKILQQLADELHTEGSHAEDGAHAKGRAS